MTDGGVASGQVLAGRVLLTDVLAAAYRGQLLTR
jgi:hypothetical protein